MENEETKQVTIRKETQLEKTLADKVQNRVKELASAGRLNLPQGYSVGNALNSAWLKILTTVDKNGKPALDVCTKESVANALLDMSILGLNPAKQQGYFIVYGTALTWFTSYFGVIAAAMRLQKVQSLPVATLIFKDDKVEIGHDELGQESIKSHETTWENRNNEIVGVYASIKFDGKVFTEILTMKEVREAWTHSKTNKEHKEFTGEFAKRTAFNRLMKRILKTSNDDDLVAETLIKSEEEHFEFETGEVIENVKKEIEEKTSSQEAEIVEQPKEDPTSSNTSEDNPGQVKMEF